MNRKCVRLFAASFVAILSVLACDLPFGKQATATLPATISEPTEAVPSATPTESLPTPEPSATSTPVITPTATPLVGNIYGYVFQDDNANSIKEEGEAGLGGVSVRLRAGPCIAPGIEERTTTTTASGYYVFTGLETGEYCVDVPVDPMDANHKAPLRSIMLVAGEWLYVDFGYGNVIP
jgi:hypothetical protein